MKYLFIDIRKSDKVYSKYLEESSQYTFYNIPMNMIRFNVGTILNQLDQFEQIYIICESSKSSLFIKNKYFKEYPKIKVNDNLQFSNLNYGPNKVSIDENNELVLNVIGNKSFNFYSITRIIQTITGILMLSVGIFTYMQLSKNDLLKKVNTVPLIVLIIFGSMSLYNGLTSTCSMSILLKNYLN